MDYQHNNVTRYLPDANELQAYYDARKGKASKTRFINSELAHAYDQRADLVSALERSPNGMLHGATHTKHDLLVYDRYISNILNLKVLKFKSIYEACNALKHEEERPYKVMIGKELINILVYGDGSFTIIK